VRCKSIVNTGRNPDTGTAAWAFQLTPHDGWDYDGVNENVLFDATVGG
jgi:glucose dehydrogenase